MNRFFTTERTKDQFLITSDEDCKHIQKVLRLRVGDQIEICDYEKEYTCEIMEVNNHVICKIIEEKAGNRESHIEITLFQGLPKLDKMDWIIQKTTELGANRIVPVSTRRSIMKVKKSSKIERWNKVAFSAAQQSKRMKIPMVDEAIDISKLMSRYGDQLDALVVPYENQDGQELKKLLAKLVGLKRIGILIGPEGGLDEVDLQSIQSDKTYLVSLGNRILRTETAAITSVGIIQYELGDLGE